MKHKKITYIVLSIVSILAIWIIFSINQPPKWIGNSKQWEAEYNRESNAPKGDWTGYLYWLGENDATLVGAELTKDGELIHELENTSEHLTSEKNSINFIHSWEPMFKNEDEKVELTIQWEDKEGEHEDTIVLNPKNRYFVLPSFIY